MIRVISLATRSHLRLAQRMATSLARHNPACQLTLYCDDDAAARTALGPGPWSCVALPSIATLGAKRAKFDAYVDALQHGAFLWLDADTIVLAGLGELGSPPPGRLLACPDDLSECAFIEDKGRPWPGDPELRAERYFNSGVFAAPADLHRFFEACASAARDDLRWQQWTIEGLLLDNHFLCAMVHREDVGVEEIDARIYNWQGLRRHGRLMVRAEQGRLIGRETGRPLAIAHFAGIGDVDAWLRHLPPAELACLARSVARDDDLLATLGALNDASSIADDSLRAAFVFQRQDWVEDRARGARDVLSCVRSVPASTMQWNGLPCGGAYLEAGEYRFLRELVRDAGVSTVVELGAGYTSVLFRTCGATVWAVESTEGPWAEAARDAGAHVSIVSLAQREAGFESGALRAALATLPRGTIDLLFVDAPVGTLNRQAAVGQLLERVNARVLVFHDAHRDAEVVFSAAAMGGFRPIRHLSSWRGLVALCRSDAAPRGAAADPLTDSRLPTVEIVPTSLSGQRVRIELVNHGPRSIESEGPERWHLSYHVQALPTQPARWDNPRHPLPCTLDAGDRIVFDLDLGNELAPGTPIWFDLVMEGRQWLSQQPDAEPPRPMVLESASGGGASTVAFAALRSDLP